MMGARVQTVCRLTGMTLVLVAAATAACAVEAVDLDSAPAAFVAGSTPDRRPERAPHITAFEKTDAWYAMARAGISEPYPLSLKFLDDQGGWFTPFIHPGMTGHFDIRGWHTHDAKAATAH